MGKPGEIDYLKNLGPDGTWHAREKPFSDSACWRYLLEIGTLMSMLPPPPARLLDLGCGTGWTSRFFGKCGYEVVGVDISPDMISAAEEMKHRDYVEKLTFVVADYEDLNFKEEFDAAVFFDSLHHAVDERLALQKAYEALRHGGLCLSSEPGEGHARSEAAVNAVEKYQVTEKDMPPFHIIELGRQLGFREFACYPFAWVNLVYDPKNPPVFANPPPASNAPGLTIRGPVPDQWNPVQRWLNSLRQRMQKISEDQLRMLLVYQTRIEQLAATPRLGGITRMVK